MIKVKHIKVRTNPLCFQFLFECVFLKEEKYRERAPLLPTSEMIPVYLCNYRDGLVNSYMSILTSLVSCFIFFALPLFSLFLLLFLSLFLFFSHSPFLFALLFFYILPIFLLFSNPNIRMNMR